MDWTPIPVIFLFNTVTTQQTDFGQSMPAPLGMQMLGVLAPLLLCGRHMGGLWWFLYLQGEVLPCPACLLHQVVKLPFTLLITWFLLLGHNFSATRVILLPYYHRLDILYQLAVNCYLWHCNSNRDLCTYAVRYCPSFKIKDELSPASGTITEFHLCCFPRWSVSCLDN